MGTYKFTKRVGKNVGPSSLFRGSEHITDGRVKHRLVGQYYLLGSNDRKMRGVVAQAYSTTSDVVWLMMVEAI